MFVCNKQCEINTIHNYALRVTADRDVVCVIFPMQLCISPLRPSELHGHCLSVKKLLCGGNFDNGKQLCKSVSGKETKSKLHQQTYGNCMISYHCTLSR